MIGGRLADQIGRRRTIIALSVMFFAGTLLVITSPGGPEHGTHTTLGFSLLVLGRVVLGLGVGGASTVVPMYLAELAPFEIRGSIWGATSLRSSRSAAAFMVNAIITPSGATTTACGGSCSRSAPARDLPLHRHAADAGVTALAHREGSL